MNILSAASSVLRFQNKFLQSFFRGFNPTICLEYLSTVYYQLGFGFFALGNLKELSEIFGLFLLVAFGFKSLCSLWFPAQISRDFTQKSRKSKNIFYSEKIVDAKSNRKSESGNCCSDLRKLLIMERRRADEARAEVERERAASGTAVEEAMAMIQRLQWEKSSIEMEFKQDRRLAEAKRLHDEEVIESLEWEVQRYEAELTTLRQEFTLFDSIPHFST